MKNTELRSTKPNKLKMSNIGERIEIGCNFLYFKIKGIGITSMRKITANIIALPVHHGLKKEDAYRIVESIKTVNK